MLTIRPTSDNTSPSSSQTSSAMNHALQLPEIVAIIVQKGATSRGFLHTCLFINQLFSLEAMRKIWRGCGCLYQEASVVWHVTPVIRDLARITQMDRERAQFYANFIRVLQFDCDISEKSDKDGAFEEATWHEDLAALQFPNLQDVGFYGSDESTPMNTGEMVLQYAQPNVKHFKLLQASEVCDSFLDIFSRRCSSLRSLILGDIEECELSEDGIVRFIDNAKSLACLRVRHALLKIWTIKEFEALARHPNLELLSIPDTPDDWLDILRHESSTSLPFPKLKHFSTGISDYGLELLAGHMPNLQQLTLLQQKLAPSHHVLASASKFTQLTNLRIVLGPNSSISGQDLIILGQKCPELSVLEISHNKEDNVRGVAINDRIIDEAARHMRNMSTLVLEFDHPDITWQSILSIGRQCKNLLTLHLPCSLTWQEAIDSAPVNTFPRLSRLALSLDKENRRDRVEECGKKEETVNAFAAHFATFAPRLLSLSMTGRNAVDQAFQSAINDVCWAKPFFGFRIPPSVNTGYGFVPSYLDDWLEECP